MRLPRRGLTVIELVLILVAVGLLAFFLLRMRSRDAEPPVADTTLAPATPAAPTGAPALTLATPLDSTAAAGAGIDVRVHATDAAGAALANAAVRFAADGGGRVEPATATTGADGDAAVRWTLGAEGVQTLRATLDGAAAPLTATVRVRDGGAGAR
jgi:hypothetical protein